MSTWSDRRAWTGSSWPKRRLRWFGDAAALILAKALPEQSDEVLATILEELLADPGRFARRVAEEEYRGRRYSAWSWKVDEKLVKEYAGERLWPVRQAMRERELEEQRREEGSQFRSLDEWLEAERCGELSAVPVFERGGWTLLSKVGSPHAEGFYSRARRRQLEWPRACRDCGAEFNWVRRWNTVRCEQCRKGGRDPGVSRGRTASKS